MNCKLSAITITYNNYDELIETLNSINSMPQCESIVVNGGNCTSTSNFLKNSDTRYISEPDQGISDAFNKGIKMATGDYIVFINSGDTVLNPTYAQKAIKYLDENPDVSLTDGDIIFCDIEAGHLIFTSSVASLGRGMPLWHPTMIYRKNVFDQVGVFKLEYKIAMDYEHLCRIRKLGLKEQHINASICSNGWSRHLVHK